EVARLLLCGCGPCRPGGSGRQTRSQESTAQRATRWRALVHARYRNGCEHGQRSRRRNGPNDAAPDRTPRLPRTILKLVLATGRVLRQGKKKGRALVRLASGPHPPAVTRYDPLHERESHTGSRKFADIVQSLEHAEQFRLVARVEACAVVTNDI